MMDIPERGTPEYLEHIEAALCLAFTTLALVAVAPMGGTVDQAEIADRSVSIVNDLAPLVGAITARVEAEATIESLANELQRLESAGLTHAAVAVRLRLETLRCRREANGG